MSAKYFHILSILIAVVGFAFVAFLYTTEPRSLAEVTTKSQVVLGTYEIDRKEYELGLASFRRDDFAAARAAFERADPEKRDAIAQFYIAYSFYREGWGRFANDDQHFRAGLAATERVVAIDPNFRIADQSLTLRTAVELKLELEEGLKITAADFNPMRLTRERK
jgi:tetratricopeptide (TPR) repeat protein